MFSVMFFFLFLVENNWSKVVFSLMFLWFELVIFGSDFSVVVSIDVCNSFDL